MFPHTVTIFNIIKEKDNNITYHREIISDVFYYIKKIISQEGKGEKYTYAYDVIFWNKALSKWVSKENYQGLENTYTLKDNDIIVLGEYKEIEDITELQKSNTNWFYIKTITENPYADQELQNIEVTN